MKRTNRGFAIYTEFKDTYDNEVRVQRSSNAGGRFCWIFCKHPDDGKLITDGLGGMIPEKSAPHLSISQAKKVIKALQDFVDGED